MTLQERWGRGVRWGVCMVMGFLVACATQAPPEQVQGDGEAHTQAPEDEVGVTCRWARGSATADSPTAAWKHYRFPGKRANAYLQTQLDGREALLVQANASTSMLRQALRVPAEDLHRLHFSWKVPALIGDADLRVPERSDSPVRIVLAFDGDRSKFSARDAMLSELANVLTGEPMPYATLMYVWGTGQAQGSVLHNHRTGRIRKLVLESGPAHLGQWRDYERDIRQDFVQAFGEEPGALVGIGIMTDTDNTRTRAQAWYGPVLHVPKSPTASPAPLISASADCAP